MNIPAGRSLELFFVDGRPDGMLTAEVFNWTGHVLMTPRTSIGAALARKEARYTGVYILLGEQEGEPRAYIGEGEDISDRIASHAANKDWWTSAVLITTAANALNKAHVKYLESRLWEEAKRVGRVTLDNCSAPTRPSLSEAAQSNMEAFLAYLFMVLPAVRVDLFIEDIRPAASSSDISSGATQSFVLSSKKRGLNATAVLQNGEFVVQEGSDANLEWIGSTTHNSVYAILHAQLCKTGVLERKGDRLVFAKSYAFKSPSAASSVITGRPSAGTVEWKLPDGTTTYKQWEANKLKQLASGAA